jgi:hypothetical protein
MKKEQYDPDAVRPPLGGTEAFEALFEHARRDAFTPEESERLWQSVVSAGPGAGDVGPEVPEVPGKGWASGAALKAAGVLVIAGGLLAASFAVKRSAPSGPATVPSVRAPSTQSLEAPRGQGEPPVVSWEDLPRALQGEARPATPRSRGPSGAAQAEPPVMETPPADAPAVAIVQEPDPAPVASAGPVLAPSEGALLLRARRQLVSDPSSALALTEEAARRFPDGALAPEREVLAIEALARLGRLPAARARFASFRAVYPQSPHLARLESLLSP